MRRLAALVAAGTALLFAGSSYLDGYCAITLVSATSTPPVYAHRGGTSAYVENTQANFRDAAAHGTRTWETDVRWTKATAGTPSGFPVLLHDPDLRRFGCPTVLITTVTVTQARTCHAPNGQTLTTLAQFTGDLATYEAVAFVELKTTLTAAQWSMLATRLSPVAGRVTVASFTAATLTAASGRGYTTQYLTSTAKTPAQLPAGTDWYAPAYATLTAAQVTAMRSARVRVVPWTPPASVWASLPDVDAVISNDREP